MAHAHTLPYSSSHYILFFIHDFIKFTYDYFTKKKLEAFLKFYEFKLLLKVFLKKKLKYYASIMVGKTT